MALARSASGPGGLSINTSSANSLFGSGTTPAAGMFGNTQASKPLFGASATTTAPQTGGIFGSTTNTSTGGLFGSTATSTSKPQAGGLFGSSTATSQPPTGGLFGSSTTVSQPQTGGLFGGTTATQPQAGGLGSTAQTSGGLFGNTNTSQTAPSGGMFSNTGSGPVQNSGTGLFGSTTSQPPQGGGIFGLQNNQKSFGNSSLNQAQQQPQPQGGLTFGQSNNQQQQTVPGVRIDIANIRGTTRFNDLHDELQKQIDHLDQVIQQQVQIKNDITAFIPAHDNDLSHIPDDVEFCRRKLIGLDAAMSSDIESIGNVQKLVTKDIEHAKLSFKAADNLRLPPQYHIPGVWPSKSTTNDNRSQNGDGEAQQDIVGYFSSTADELSSTLGKYQKNISEIELHLRNVESTSAQQVASLVSRRNGGSASEDDAIRELAAALTEFEQGILHVAGKVGGAREGLQALQLGGFTGPSDVKLSKGRRSGVY